MVGLATASTAGRNAAPTPIDEPARPDPRGAGRGLRGRCRCRPVSKASTVTSELVLGLGEGEEGGVVEALVARSPDVVDDPDLVRPGSVGPP